MRPIELTGEDGILVKDLHPDQNTITMRNHKGCAQRPPLKITPELMAKLQAYVQRWKLQPTDTLFTSKPRTLAKTYRNFKTRLAKKLNDTTILSIRLYDLRHYYITKQLRRTQNAEIVRQIMGHKRLDTTQKYLHLLSGTSGEWIVEGTTDKERAKTLLQQDYTYQLTTPDGTMIFRKPK